jgi:two-component system, LytTR family, sensor kinase
MQSLQKIRNYEFLLITFASIIYVLRKLFQQASKFDSFIITAEANKIPSKIIWDSLRNYDHIYNTNFPTIIAACLFLIAWFLIHYLVFPRIKEQKFDSTTFTYLFIIVVIVVSGVQIFEYLKLYIRYKHDSSGNIIGLKVFSEYRKLYVLQNSASVFVLFLLYEGFAQFYYFIHTKLSQEEEPNFRYLDYFLAASISISILFIAFFDSVSSEDLWKNSPVRIFWIIGTTVLTIYFSQKYFYLKVLPFFSNIKSKEFISDCFVFLIICFAGSFINWLVASFPFRFELEALFILFTIAVVFSILVAFFRKIIFREKTQLQTQIVSKSAELSSLRSQINPHFLFNTLNTLYSVSLKENAERTSDGIQKLGDMMRFMLNENHQDRIPLSKEIEYLHNYIDIQRMRIDENHDVEIKVNIQNNEREVFISPMLLNPFVENAFKHGISFRNPSWIYITLTQDLQKIYFKVHNSLHPKHENSPEENNNGIGLENVRKRLELIYPNRHTLDIQASDNDFFVSLIIGIY